MGKGALILGGSEAAIQAAMDLADSGIAVHLVEASPFLGSEGATTVPGHLFRTRLLEAARHPNVTVWTNTRVNRVEGAAGRFQVELRRHPRYVDLSKCTACGECIAVCPVTVPGTNHRAIDLPADGQPGCAAITKVGKPPCSNACPGGIHVQGYVALTAQGRFREAIDLIREAIPFPGICGRICTHPCEINCRRSEVDKPVAIRLLKRFLADWELTEQGTGESAQGIGQKAQGRDDRASSVERSARVAVVGAGPGGMATAERLARLGYAVTVFEKEPVIGGMMGLGIPEYRLPRSVIAHEYEQIAELGVEIRLNTRIGPGGDHTLDGLFEMGYRAVCLAIGAHHGHELRIAGEELPGVVQGIELLRGISLSQQVADPQYRAALERLLRRGPETRVAVLGGGNTAMDVSRSLRRFGVRDVRILYRRTRAEMPAMPEEVEDAEREGVQIEFLVAPVRVVGDAGTGVTGLECLRMKLGEADASGRRRPVPIAGSETLVAVDLVVLAIGQAPDLGLLGADPGLAVTRDERINVDGVTFMTNRPGVFACGDAVTADKMAVIEAIGMGKKAAAAIDSFLKGVQPSEVVVDARQVPIARREMRPEELVPKLRIAAPALPLPERLASFAEVELGYSAEQAMLEAGRCLVCGPCSECMACVRACQPGAILHDEQESLATLDIGAILYTGEWPGGEGASLAAVTYGLEQRGLYRMAPDSPLSGSAAAAKAMFDLLAERVPAAAVRHPAVSGEEARIGVFVCRCGDEIARIVDTAAVRDRAAAWPGVAHAQELPFSCTDEAAAEIRGAAQTHRLNRVVLAACSCCAIDQVCYSCTFQRVRCKSNLGIFAPPSRLPAAEPFSARLRGGAKGAEPTLSSVEPFPPSVAFEFVNIREQCAWAHADDPSAATAKATALVGGAVARARLLTAPADGPRQVEPSVLVVGSGPAAARCLARLRERGFPAQAYPGVPDAVQRAEGAYIVRADGGSWRASALVVAPAGADEADALRPAFGPDGLWPRPVMGRGAAETHRPGLFVCDPTLDAEEAALAATADVAAWLGRAAGRSGLTVAVVDPARCRACNTCVEVCEFGAARLVGTEPNRTSQIDPLMCTGCGTCAAHCPSGAITAGYSTDGQIEAALEAILGQGGEGPGEAAPHPRAIVFTCNWGAYSSLERAGAERRSYSPGIYPIRVMCAGRLNPAHILKAFEKGADGVLVAGCPPGECHFEFGNRRAEEVLAQTRELAALLGMRDEQLRLEWLAAGEDEGFLDAVQRFVAGLDGGRR